MDGAGVRDKDAVGVERDRQTDRHEHPSFSPNFQNLSKCTLFSQFPIWFRRMELSQQRMNGPKINW